MSQLQFYLAYHMFGTIGQQKNPGTPPRTKSLTLYVQAQDGGQWQPETWVQLVQPITAFLHLVVQRVGCNTEEALASMLQHVNSLQQAVELFQQLPKCSGEFTVLNNLSSLER